MPSEKRNLAWLKRTAQIVYPTFTTVFLTSTDWAGVAAEVSAVPNLHTNKGHKPTKKNFSRLNIGRLTAVNSGTEDQGVCDLLNAAEERKCDFRAKIERFGVRPEAKKQVETVDAASTHEMPDDLRKEAQEKLRRKYNTLNLEVVP